MQVWVGMQRFTFNLGRSSHMDTCCPGTRSKGTIISGKTTASSLYIYWRHDIGYSQNHILGLLWLQDLVLSGTIAICYKLVTDRWLRIPCVEHRDRVRWLHGVVRPSCIADLRPVDIFGQSFDVHVEIFGIFFVTCGYAAFRRGLRRGYLYGFLTALCGTAAIVYVLSLGLFFVSRSQR